MRSRHAAVAILATLALGTGQAAEAARRVVVVGRAPHLRVVATEVVVVEPGRGRLHVNVDPERARVYVDGRYQGRGDRDLVVRPGNHRVRVVLNGNRSASETVRVDPGHVTRVRLDLD